MTRRIPALLILLLMAGFVISGCGGSDKSKSETTSQGSSSNSSSAAATATTPAQKAKAKKQKAKAKAKKVQKSKAAAPTPLPTTTKTKAQARKQVKDSCKNIAKANADAGKLCEQRGTGASEQSTKQLALKVCLQQVDAAGLSKVAADAAKKQCQDANK